MNDYFALLGEPHRPWLDPEALKQKFLTLSAEVHPDRVHLAGEQEKRTAGLRYADLNQAYLHLRRPKERLQHLLELETGARPAQVQQIPPDLTEFFLQVGQALKRVDAFLAEKTRTTSPLLHARLFEAGQAQAEQLQTLQRQIGARQSELITELQAIDARWIGPVKPDPVSRATMLRRLEHVYRLFSYFTRWEEQIQERLVQLVL